MCNKRKKKNKKQRVRYLVPRVGWIPNFPGGGMILRILGYKSSVLIVHVYKRAFLTHTPHHALRYMNSEPKQPTLSHWARRRLSKTSGKLILCLSNSFKRFNVSLNSLFWLPVLNFDFLLAFPFLINYFGKRSAECVWYCIWIHWIFPYIGTWYNIDSVWSCFCLTFSLSGARASYSLFMDWRFHYF